MPDNFENIVQEVQEEVKKFGDGISGIKKNQEELLKDYTEFKASMEEKNSDVLLDEKLDKFTTALAVRQDEIDKANAEIKEAEEALNKRMDDLEVILQRTPKGSDDDKVMEKAIEFAVSCAIAKSRKDSGIDVEEMQAIKESASVDTLKSYEKLFENYLRRSGGTKEYVLSPEDAKTLSVGVDPHGGYTVTPEMSSTIIGRVRESDPIRQLANIETISTDSIEWLVDVDEAGAGWETETNLGSQTDTPDFQKKEIFVHNMYARAWATQKILEDSSLNIENWIGNKIAERFSRLEAAAFVSGDGIGKPRGFLTYADGTSWGQIEQVAMGAAAALTADGFIDIKYAMTEYYLQRASAWLMNRTTLQAAMKLKDGAGDYIWKPGLIANDPSSFILGIPVRMSTTMPTVAANALSVALADWRDAYTIVDRLSMSIQRDPYTQKPFVEFYVRKRCGGDIVSFDAIKIGIIST